MPNSLEVVLYLSNVQLRRYEYHFVDGAPPLTNITTSVLKKYNRYAILPKPLHLASIGLLFCNVYKHSMTYCTIDVNYSCLICVTKW